LTISEGKIVGVIFMDLKRAFEIVDREKFLENYTNADLEEWF